MWHYIHNGTLFSHEKEWNHAICSNIIDLEMFRLSEIRQDKNCMLLLCGIENMAQMNLPTEQKQTHRHGEQTCGCQGGGSGLDGEFGLNGCKLRQWEWMSSEVPLCSTGNSSHSLGIDQDGRLYEKKNGYICMTGSLCCTAELTSRCKSTLIKKEIKCI